MQVEGVAVDRWGGVPIRAQPRYRLIHDRGARMALGGSDLDETVSRGLHTRLLQGLGNTVGAAHDAAAGFTDLKVLSVRKVLRRTTAGFAASRNNGRDINSNDSLINYLRRPNG